MQALAAGGVDVDRLTADLPVVVWLIHGVHGNEISSSDAALQGVSPAGRARERRRGPHAA